MHKTNIYMKIADFEFKDGNHFIAMEYYGLILNRTYLIILANNKLTGMVVNGLVSVETHGKGAIITNQLAIKGDLTNPYAYIKKSYFDKVKNLDLFEEELLKVNKSNFRININDISNAVYDSRKKWGMGTYPHDGKVYLETKTGKKREFIILGNQRGSDIANWLLLPQSSSLPRV
jgi:hypothetical protein